MNFSYLDKKAAQEIIATFIYQIEYNDSNQRVAATSWEELESDISAKAQNLLADIRALEPATYGSERKKIENSERGNLVVICNQTFHTTSDSHTLPPRLLPAKTYHAFRRLNRQLQKDVGRKLIVKSGYRSPAYQLYIFLYNLKQYDWNIEKTLDSVALPGYSEHSGTPQALDLRAKRHVGHEASYDFSRTPHFRWLKDNAKNFGFSLSYPKQNSSGTSFEPWHWRHSHPAS